MLWNSLSIFLWFMFLNLVFSEIVLIEVNSLIYCVLVFSIVLIFFWCVWVWVSIGVEIVVIMVCICLCLFVEICGWLYLIIFIFSVVIFFVSWIDCVLLKLYWWVWYFLCRV